jgi:hypothetical protein
VTSLLPFENGFMSASIWEQCGTLLSGAPLLAQHSVSSAPPRTSSSQLPLPLAAAPALPVAAALDLVGDFRVDDRCCWPKLNVAPKSRDEDLILDPSAAYLPSTVAKFLRSYQLEGVKFIHSHFVRGQGCILADDMGLGKTVQTIAFFYVVLGKSGTQSDLDSLGYRNRDSPKVLLVLPASVMYQWQGELDSWMCCSVCMYVMRLVVQSRVLRRIAGRNIAFRYHGSERIATSLPARALFGNAFMQALATCCSPQSNEENTML